MENKTIIYKETVPVSSTLFVIRFYKPDSFTFLPGQFITLVVPTSENPLYRSYSISSHPDNEYVELTVKFPEGSRMLAYLEQLSDGDVIEFRGPQGRYVYQDNDLEKIHIVTGAGIGPNYSMLQEWVKEHSVPSQLYFGMQKKENVPYLEQLRKWKEEYDFNYYICVSREDGDSVETYSGRVLPVLEQTMDDYENKEFYLCGLPDMVRGVVAFLQEKGVEGKNIHFERFEAARK